MLLIQVCLPEYFDEFLLIWASEKFVADSDETVDDDIWFEWFDECVDSPWICGDDTGDGEDDTDKLLDSDMADPGKWWDNDPEEETPAEDDGAKEDPPCAWFDIGAPGWLAALNNWFEYNWSTVAECIGNTASISHSLFQLNYFD